MLHATCCAMPQLAFSVPSLLTFELIQNPAYLHIISRSVQQVKSFATYSFWRAFDPPSRNRCSLQSVPATVLSAAAWDSTHWQRLLFVRFRSAFRFYVVVNFVMYLGPSIQNVSSRNLSTLLEISRRHDHTQQDLVRSLEVLLYFKYRT